MAAADVEYRCFVGGLAWATTEQVLEDAFSQYGQVVDSKVCCEEIGSPSSLSLI